MLLARIPTNSIHSLGSPSRILCQPMTMDFFLAGDGATGRREGAVGYPLVVSLKKRMSIHMSYYQRGVSLIM